MRKGASGIDLLGVIALGFVVAGVTLTVGAKVMADVQTALGGNSTAGYQTDAYLAMDNGTDALANISDNLPLIGTVIGLVIVISFVLMLKR